MSLSKFYRFASIAMTLVLILSACSEPAAQISQAAPTAEIQSTQNVEATQSTSSSDSAASPNQQIYELAAGSTASFSVREQLASLPAPNDAIGSTESISGQIALNADGSIDSANSKFVVKAATLKTDNGMRDNYVSSRLLQTSQYPEIIFIPKETKDLPNPIPANGEVNFQLIGDLTILNVTRSVTWNVTGTVSDGKANGTAETNFKFGDFELQQPQVRSVLSIVDNIKLTVNLVLQPK